MDYEAHMEVLFFFHVSGVLFLQFTPLKTNMTMEHHNFNRRYIFKWLVFHCHASFPGCTLSETKQSPLKNGWAERPSQKIVRDGHPKQAESQMEAMQKLQVQHCSDCRGLVMLELVETLETKICVEEKY